MLQTQRNKKKGTHNYMNASNDIKITNLASNGFVQQHNYSFRNPKYQISLKKLALYEKEGYWKFSQSSPNMGYTEELPRVYENYNTTMTIVEAQDKEMMLSFVSARNLYKCIFFGDQITHLLFDVDNSTFQSIMNSPAYKQGNIFEEIKTDFLIPLESYSISEPETIQYIFVYDIYRKKLEKLAKIDSKFKKSFAFVEYVQKLTTSIFKGRWEKKIKYISENLDDLITDFYSMYKEP